MILLTQLDRAKTLKVKTPS